MSKRAYAICSGIAISGAIMIANVALLANLTADELSLASIMFTALLGAGTTLAGRGK